MICIWLISEKTKCKSSSYNTKPNFCEIKQVNTKGNQSWIFIGRTTLMLKLKLQYSGHLMRRDDSLEKILMLGKIEGMKRKGRQRTRWLDGITTQWTWVWASSGRWWRTGSLVCCSPWGHKESDMTERLNNTFMHRLLIFTLLILKKKGRGQGTTFERRTWPQDTT